MQNIVEHSLEFKADPRLIYEALGSKIIEFDSISIAEQIKNAADAKAKDIIIDFSKINQDIIEIRDSGSGMTLEEIEENWLLIASSHKNHDFTQQGGKGIGRFSLFRLANSIEITTVSNKKKYSFKLVKRTLETLDNLSDIKINILESESSETNGTIIRLNEINNINLDEITEDLINLNLPFKNRNFKVLYPDSYDEKKYMDPKLAIVDAPFFATVEFKGNQIISYEFNCVYHGNKVHQNSNTSILQTRIDLKKIPSINIGETKVVIYNYFFDGKYSNVTSEKENELKLRFLSAYQGISVYRKSYKIYGHGKEDWLKLAEKRLKRPGDNIDNKLTFGYVILDSEKSINLEEKTNREGFIRNETSTYFTEMMDTIVTYFGLDRKNSAQKLKRLIDKSGTAKRPNLFTLNNIGTTGTTGTGTTGTGTTGTGTTGAGTTGTGTTGAGTTGTGTTGTGTTGAGTTGTGTTGAGTTGTGTTGTGTTGTGTTGTGTTGAGTTGTGTTGTGTTGTGTTGTGTTGSIGIGRKNTYTKSTNIGFIDPNIKNNISSPKVKALINEITTINIEKYPLATGFLLRSLTEVMMDEYLRKNLSSLQSHFKDYIINNDNNIKKSFSISNGHNEKDIPIKTKLMDFKKYFSNTSKFDSRSLKHIDDLANIIDEINLAMHWTDKTIAINKLQTNWQNSVFFIEFICKSI